MFYELCDISIYDLIVEEDVYFEDEEIISII